MEISRAAPARRALRSAPRPKTRVSGQTLGNINFAAVAAKPGGVRRVFSKARVQNRG